MTKAATVVAEAVTPVEDGPKAPNLYRAFIVDVDTDPDNPIIKGLFKRGHEYPETQKLVRDILKGSDDAKDEHLYLDAECTEVFDVGAPDGEPEPAWNLALVRKQRSTNGKKAGIDREWLKILMANDQLSAEEKMAQLAKFI